MSNVKIVVGMIATYAIVSGAFWYWGKRKQRNIMRKTENLKTEALASIENTGTIPRKLHFDLVEAWAASRFLEKHAKGEYSIYVTGDEAQAQLKDNTIGVIREMDAFYKPYGLSCLDFEHGHGKVKAKSDIVNRMKDRLASIIDVPHEDVVIH